MIECKKFLTMERVKVHRELIQHLKAFTYKNECQQDKILNIEDLVHEYCFKKPTLQCHLKC